MGFPLTRKSLGQFSSGGQELPSQLQLFAEDGQDGREIHLPLTFRTQLKPEEGEGPGIQEGTQEPPFCPFGLGMERQLPSLFLCPCSAWVPRESAGGEVGQARCGELDVLSQD